MDLLFTMKFSTLCEVVTEEIYEEMLLQKIETEDDFDREMSDIIHYEIDYTVENLTQTERDAILQCIAKKIVSYTIEIMNEHGGAWVFKNMTAFEINNLVIYKAIQDELNIEFETYKTGYIVKS
jgi:hypothetical protein